MRRDLIVTTLAWVILGSCVAVQAEVRVVTDRNGSYKATRVLRGGNSSDVWSLLHRGNGKYVLNTGGFGAGDLFPTIRESTVAPHAPWVVWSRYNHGRYDLVWSRWGQGGWNPVLWLEPSNQEPGDNLDADLVFDDTGRPYVVWWRNDAGRARVYLSTFLNPGWMRPYLVSEPGVDARHPRIRVDSTTTVRSVVVTFETVEGVVEQTVLFELPVTITDDINPLDYVYSGGTSFKGN
jgi:hypothetical protein